MVSRHESSAALDQRSRDLRLKIVRAMAGSRRGHLASAFSLVEILRVLYDDVLRFDPSRPQDEQRDRCLLSKGHGCLALYAILADKGYFPESTLDTFCRFDSVLGGHPEYGKVPGVEASTGSLGHGLSIAVGMACAMRIKGNDAFVHPIFSDGECNEGSTWEAALCASKHRLHRLVALLDYNRRQSYGSTTEVLELEPLADKWRSFGWRVREVDGHDVAELRQAIGEARREQAGPQVIICHTVKGKGVGFVENNGEWHHKNRVTDDEFALLRAALEANHA